MSDEGLGGDWGTQRTRTRSQPQPVITYGDEEDVEGVSDPVVREGFDRRVAAPVGFGVDMWRRQLSPGDTEDGGADDEADALGGAAQLRSQRWDSLTPSPPGASSVPSYPFAGSRSLFSFTQPGSLDDTGSRATSEGRRLFDGDGSEGGGIGPIHSAPFLSPLSSAVGLEDLQQSYDSLLSDGDEDDNGLEEPRRRSGGPLDAVPPSPAHFFLLSSPSVAWTRPVTIIDDKETAGEEEGGGGGKRAGRVGAASATALHALAGLPLSDLSVAARPFYPST